MLGELNDYFILSFEISIYDCSVSVNLGLFSINYCFAAENDGLFVLLLFSLLETVGEPP
jgi:hypothetical protein